MLYERSSRMTTSRALPAAATGVAPGTSGRAKASAMSVKASARSSSSGQLRIARRRVDLYGIFLRNINDGNATVRRRSRWTRCTMIGIATAASPTSSAGARNLITVPGSTAPAWRGSERERDRAAPTF